MLVGPSNKTKTVPIEPSLTEIPDSERKEAGGLGGSGGLGMGGGESGFSKLMMMVMQGNVY